MCDVLHFLGRGWMVSALTMNLLAFCSLDSHNDIEDKKLCGWGSWELTVVLNFSKVRVVQ